MNKSFRPVRVNDSSHAVPAGSSELTEELLQKGFRLAYFIVRDPDTAAMILSDAVDELKMQRTLEKKRLYWRSKSLKRKITKIVRDDGDALQWLIYCKATPYEMRMERCGSRQLRDVIVGYIKHLVQITTDKSAFYVNIGIRRLLYNYTTPEARKGYEWIASHYTGAETYRSVKGVLMRKIEERFREGLIIGEGNQGERRFEVFEQQDRLVRLVEQCLRLFTPWSTQKPCLAGGGLVFQKAYRDASLDSDETRYCHVFTDPFCYEQLTNELKLDSPRHRLAVPRFLNLSKNGVDDDDPGGLDDGVPKLPQHEIDKILRRVEEEAMRRQQASPEFLRILVDGKEYAHLDVIGPDSKARCELPDGTKLIEIWSDAGEKSVHLATHWVDYSRWDGAIPAAATVDLGKGRELLLVIDPVEETAEREAYIALGLRCRPVSMFTALKETLGLQPGGYSHMPKFALAATVLLAIGSSIAAVRLSRELHVQRQKAEHMKDQLADEKNLRAELQQRFDAAHQQGSYELIPNEFWMRGEQGVKEPVITFSAKVDLVNLDLPVGNNEGASYRAVLKPFMGDQEVMSETFAIGRESTGEKVVSFVLPVALVQTKHHYVLELYAVVGSGKPERIHRFNFYVLKN